MKAIAKIKELEGKTIKIASEVGGGEGIALIFNDESCAFFDVKHYRDGHDMYLNNNPSDYLKRDVGIITEEEYEKIKAAEKMTQAERIKIQELKQLERLKAKYAKANQP